MRIFIAIELPEDIKKEIDGFQKEISSRVFLKMVPPKNLHLTLFFLGEILETDKDKVVEAVREGIKEIKPFHLFLGKPELFPRHGRIHGLWINIKGQLDILHKLYQQIQAEFENREIVYDHKPFIDHITAGRAKGKTPRLEFSPMTKGEFLVDSVSVYSSKLTPKGPIYSKVVTIQLE